MGGVVFTSKGDWSRTTRFLQFIGTDAIYKNLDAAAARGVAALQSATPFDSGETANAWSYEIAHSGHSWSIRWLNDHLDSQGTPVAILLQYGHGTRNGGYVQGRDFINPAIRPIFDEIAESVWKAVTSA